MKNVKYKESGEYLVSFIPEGCKRILDVSCGPGHLAKAIKANMDVYIEGIEKDQQFAEQANQHIDKLHITDIEQNVPDLGEFDLIIFNHVFELVKDPWNLLKKLSKFLKKGGHVLSTIHNVQNYRILGNLILGNWYYEQVGVLSKEHLRFFASAQIKELFDNAGLTLIKVNGTTQVDHFVKTAEDAQNKLQSWKQTGIINDFKKVLKAFFGDDPNFPEEIDIDLDKLMIFQYIIVAQK